MGVVRSCGSELFPTACHKTHQTQTRRHHRVDLGFGDRIGRSAADPSAAASAADALYMRGYVPDSVATASKGLLVEHRCRQASPTDVHAPHVICPESSRARRRLKAERDIEKPVTVCFECI